MSRSAWDCRSPELVTLGTIVLAVGLLVVGRDGYYSERFNQMIDVSLFQPYFSWALIGVGLLLLLAGLRPSRAEGDKSVR